MTPQLHKYLRFSMRSWLSETRLRVSTLVILIFTYSVTLFLIQSAFNFQGIMNRWGDSTKITVYLSDGQTPETREKIEQSIVGLEEVQKIQFVSQDEAVAQFKSKNSIFSKDFLEDLKSQEVFPESFEVTLKGSIRDESYFSKIQETSKIIGGFVGVDEVSYGQGWIERYGAFLRLTNSLVTIIVVLFILASLVIISNLIRVLVYNQREEIEILELIGETARNIRMPFIFEGFMFSLTAYIVGTILNLCLFYWISSEFAGNSMLSHLAEIVAAPSLLFLIVGFLSSCIVGLLSAFITVRSINTGWALSSRTK
jgi:cell division transport system permease protein